MLVPASALRVLRWVLPLLVIGSWLGVALHAAPDDIEEDPVNELANAGGRGFAVGQIDFDQWVFQMHGSNEAAGFKRLETLLELRLEEIGRFVSLSEEQLRKLRAAAEGDAERFRIRIRLARARFDEIKQNQDRWQEIWQEIQPLQQQLQVGIHGAGSLFDKTVSRVLTGEQRLTYYQADRERMRYRWGASVDAAIVQLEKSVPLRHAQRVALRKLMMEGDRHLQPENLQNAMLTHTAYQTMLQLPKESLRPIFTERQWKTVELMLNNNGLAPVMPQAGD